MKKFLMIALALLLICGGASAERSEYPRFGNVIDIEYDTFCYTIDDGMGNLWDYFADDYFFQDDLVCMVMDDNGTPDYLYDDCVVDCIKITYEDGLKIVIEWQRTHDLNFLKNFSEIL